MKPWRIELPKLGGHTARPVGVIGRELFCQIRYSNTVEIWALQMFLPNSWQQKWVFKFEELIYASSVTTEDGFVNILFTGCIDNKEEVVMKVLRVAPGEQQYSSYRSADSENVLQLMGQYDLHPETDVMQAGRRDLFVYDRGTVEGQVSLLRLRLDHEQKSFSGQREVLPAPPREARLSIYGALVDPDRKFMVRLSDSHRLHVFEEDRWAEYALDADDSDLNLHALGANYTQIGVTFNERFRRASMVQSPVSLVGGRGQCVLMYKTDGKTFLFRVVLDREARTFRLKRVGVVNERIRQSFNFCTVDAVVLLGRPSYLVWLDTLSLRELSYFKAQQVCNCQKSDEPIRKKCRISHSKPLL